MPPVGAIPEPSAKRYVLHPMDASAGMVKRHLEVDPRDVVFIKGLVEASEGLATLFAERGGSIVLAAPTARAAALDELVSDLEAHHGVRVVRGDTP